MWASIAADRRHYEARILQRTPRSERQYPTWPLKLVWPIFETPTAESQPKPHIHTQALSEAFAALSLLNDTLHPFAPPTVRDETVKANLLLPNPAPDVENPNPLYRPPELTGMVAVSIGVPAINYALHMVPQPAGATCAARLANSALGAATKAAVDFGGEVGPFSGDSCLIYFRADHLPNALRAAEQIVRSASRLRAIAKPYDIRRFLHVQVGIDAGNGAFATVGSFAFVQRGALGNVGPRAQGVQELSAVLGVSVLATDEVARLAASHPPSTLKDFSFRRIASDAPFVPRRVIGDLYSVSIQDFVEERPLTAPFDESLQQLMTNWVQAEGNVPDGDNAASLSPESPSVRPPSRPAVVLKEGFGEANKDVYSRQTEAALRGLFTSLDNRGTNTVTKAQVVEYCSALDNMGVAADSERISKLMQHPQLVGDEMDYEQFAFVMLSLQASR
eukprot:NODE_1327_length_1468_cov_16.430585_g1100_i0.p1 GENE.NODE_1327_length_1468_cov_16.430585_g1100_i0~~NODE_1327_length_1468_cov_16.430585_g1100_i0.p1  ORF type:complete len:448 (-),score=87.63 NODE_1327_length_1468_cov_16.430585_g1100_i0:46-1389(-)